MKRTLVSWTVLGAAAMLVAFAPLPSSAPSPSERLFHFSMNILRYPFIKAALKNRWPQFTIMLIALAGFLLALLWGLFGTPATLRIVRPSTCYRFHRGQPQ